MEQNHLLTLTYKTPDIDAPGQILIQGQPTTNNELGFLIFKDAVSRIWGIALDQVATFRVDPQTEAEDADHNEDTPREAPSQPGDDTWSSEPESEQVSQR